MESPKWYVAGCRVLQDDGRRRHTDSRVAVYGRTRQEARQRLTQHLAGHIIVDIDVYESHFRQ